MKQLRRAAGGWGGVGHLAELNLTISTGEGSERLHAQVLMFDKRSKIIAQFKSVQDGISAVLSFGARLQTGPLHRWSLTAFFFWRSSQQ